MVGSSKSTFLLGQKAYFFSGLVGIRSFPFKGKMHIFSVAVCCYVSGCFW